MKRRPRVRVDVVESLLVAQLHAGEQLVATLRLHVEAELLLALSFFDGGDRF